MIEASINQVKSYQVTISQSSRSNNWTPNWQPFSFPVGTKRIFQIRCVEWAKRLFNICLQVNSCTNLQMCFPSSLQMDFTQSICPVVLQLFLASVLITSPKTWVCLHNQMFLGCGVARSTSCCSRRAVQSCLLKAAGPFKETSFSLSLFLSEEVKGRIGADWVEFGKQWEVAGIDLLTSYQKEVRIWPQLFSQIGWLFSFTIFFQLVFIRMCEQTSSTFPSFSPFNSNKNLLHADSQQTKLMIGLCKWWQLSITCFVKVLLLHRFLQLL